MKFSELEQGFSMEGVFTTAKKLEYFNTLKMWCLDEEDGFMKINYRMARVYKVVFGLSVFYDIDMDMLNDEKGEICLAGFISTYDKCEEYKLDVLILENEKLYDIINELEMDMEQEIRLSTSLEKVIYDGIKKLIDKIPEIDTKTVDSWIKRIPKLLDKVSPENKKIIADVLEQQKVKTK